MSDPSPLDLQHTYLQLKPGGDARAWEAETFWRTVAEGALPDAPGAFGVLVATFAFSGDWERWERHPAGDEIVCLLTGRITLVLEDQGGTREVPLDAGQTALVPRGVWHTARVHEPATALHVTPGEGTEHRS